MKEIQLHQQDSFQACADWSQALLIVNVHMDTEAANFVHNMMTSKVQENNMLLGKQAESIQPEASGKVGNAQHATSLSYCCHD